VQAGGTWGTYPAILPRIGVSFRYLTRAEPGQLALRATALGSYGQSKTSAGDLRVAMGALELEACAWGWSDAVMGIEPCAGLEFGLVSAKTEGPTGLTDTGPWATGFVRGCWHRLFGARWGLEAHLGGFAPWFRYEYAGHSEQSSVYRMKAVGLDGSLGAFLVLD
jgi:hypothetical protein